MFPQNFILIFGIFFMKKVNLDIIFAYKISSITFYLEEALVIPFKKFRQSVMSMNIQIFE